MLFGYFSTFKTVSFEAILVVPILMSRDSDGMKERVERGTIIGDKTVTNNLRSKPSIARTLKYALFAGLFLFFCTSGWPWNIGAEAQATRKVKTSVPPEYPELARRLNLKGVARVQLKVGPEGTVKDVRELGGNPVLLDALVKAVKKWKYEPADKETLVEVQFEFTGS